MKGRKKERNTERKKHNYEEKCENCKILDGRKRKNQRENYKKKSTKRHKDNIKETRKEETEK